jgi:hypothetical protein
MTGFGFICHNPNSLKKTMEHRSCAEFAIKVQYFYIRYRNLLEISTYTLAQAAQMKASTHRRRLDLTQL